MVSLGRHLHSKLREAIPMSQKHRAAFNAFTATFSKDLVQEWTEMLAVWQADTNAPNPFEEKLLGKFAVL